jgi:hypothetical protein
MSTTDSSATNNGEKKTPDQIRAEIDATREGLGFDVDALADKVDPSQVAHRQVEKVKSRFTNAKESVFGTVHDKTSSTGNATDTAKQAGQQAAEKVKGNPLAVGLLAFGAGWLVSSLIPATEKEQDLAGQVKEQAAPLVDQAKSAAQDLKGPAQDAVASVKDTAQDAAGTVKDEAQGAASDVKDSAQGSADEVKNA